MLVHSENVDDLLSRLLQRIERSIRSRFRNLKGCQKVAGAVVAQRRPPVHGSRKGVSCTPKAVLDASGTPFGVQNDLYLALSGGLRCAPTTGYLLSSLRDEELLFTSAHTCRPI